MIVERLLPALLGQDDVDETRATERRRVDVEFLVEESSRSRGREEFSVGFVLDVSSRVSGAGTTASSREERETRVGERLVPLARVDDAHASQSSVDVTMKASLPETTDGRRHAEQTKGKTRRLASRHEALEVLLKEGHLDVLSLRGVSSDTTSPEQFSEDRSIDETTEKPDGARVLRSSRRERALYRERIVERAIAVHVASTARHAMCIRRAYSRREDALQSSLAVEGRPRIEVVSLGDDGLYFFLHDRKTFGRATEIMTREHRFRID